MSERADCPEIASAIPAPSPLACRFLGGLAILLKAVRSVLLLRAVRERLDSEPLVALLAMTVSTSGVLAS